MEHIDYTTVTEVTGNNVTKEQITRMYTRYRFASKFCENKDLLEVACGSGQGLGYLSTKAKSVVGVDIDKNLIAIAEAYYAGREKIQLRQVDAHKLPFEDESFDAVLLYEAIYYFSNPKQFIQEAKRVLRKEGVLIICSANKEWDGFNPSPYSHDYFSAKELYSLLKENNFSEINVYADCPVDKKTFKNQIICFIKKSAVSLNLIPKTMKGKELFKRLFFGRLYPLPPEIKEAMAEYIKPVPIYLDSPCSSYKVIFAVGHKI